MPPYELLPLVRVIAELRLAEVSHAVPPVRPGNVWVLGIEAVDVEVLHTVLLVRAPPAVHVVQCPALAQGDEQ